MDAHCVIEVFLCDSLQDGNCEALSDFSCMRAEEVDANYSVLVCLVDHHLRVAILGAIVVEVPLKGFVDAAVCDDIVGSEVFSGVFLAVADAAVLDGREDGGGDIAVAHEASAIVEKPSC